MRAFLRPQEYTVRAAFAKDSRKRLVEARPID
jgi:hypothetical protein